MPAPLTIAGFLGEIHTIDAKLLPGSAGVLSTNQRPGRGDLRSWLAPLTVETIAASPQRLSIYEMTGGYWFAWTDVVNACKGFDGQDTTERFYFTGSGSPKWTNNDIGLSGGPPYPQATRELSVPAPTTIMTTSITVVGTGTVSDVLYVQTFVNDLGWESAPGPATANLSVAEGSTIDVGNLDVAPSGSYGITLTRIYKAITATDGSAAFLFHSEHAVGTTDITDAGEPLQEQLATGAIGVGRSWTPPPDDGFGLTPMWNGMLAMCSGKSVYVCEPFEPYAWPVAYRIDVADNVVGVAVFGQQMVVLTDGDAYLVQGGDPASLDSQPMKIFQPCLSARSIVSFPDGVAWACPSGLWWYGNMRNGLLTMQVLDRAQWQDYAPSTMKCSRHADLRLIFAFYDNGDQLGFCLDVDNPSGLYGIDFGADAVYRAPDGAMHVLVGTDIKKWDADTSLLTTSFKSKNFDMPAPSKLSALEVVATNYPVAVEVWGDGNIVFNGSVTSQVPVRMKPGMFQNFQAQVSTSAGPCQAVRLAEDMDDLRQG